MSDLPVPDPPKVPALPASEPLTSEVIEHIVEKVASPAATETVEWIHAITQAEEELGNLREVVAEIREFHRSEGWETHDEAGPA